MKASTRSPLQDAADRVAVKLTALALYPAMAKGLSDVEYTACIKRCEAAMRRAFIIGYDKGRRKARDHR